MELYLVRHAESKTEEEDPARPLSENGKKEAGKIASRLSLAGVKPAEIFHSPKLRAVQTADIFSSHFRVRSREMPGLKPNDEPGAAAEFAEAQARNVMLVGHLPHLSRLASLLLCGNADEEVVKLGSAAALCLLKEEKWKIKWLLGPELA